MTRHPPRTTDELRFAGRSLVAWASLWVALLATLVTSMLRPATAIAAEETKSPRPVTRVGMAGRMGEVLLPGPELVAKPWTDRKAPLVLRVVSAQPHGSKFRYELEYYGLTAGSFNLMEYLVRRDGQPVGELPPLEIRVESTAGEGLRPPHPARPASGPKLGGYRLAILLAGGTWVAGLAAIVLVGRLRRRRQPAAQPAAVDPLAHWRWLCQTAAREGWTIERRAEVERLVIDRLRRRHALEDLPPAAALARLRQQQETAPLLNRLEGLLHRPATDLADWDALLQDVQSATAAAPAALGGAS